MCDHWDREGSAHSFHLDTTEVQEPEATGAECSHCKRREHTLLSSERLCVCVCVCCLSSCLLMVLCGSHLIAESKC